jgi:Ni/Co efflux regulator RcnB
LNEARESGKGLADKLKVEMFDVLTDEQWNRMLNLIDNPPEHAKKIIAQMREKSEQESAYASTEAWQPGPNSWKPGDPIPEGYRQQRQERGRFPRVNQSE